MADIDNLRDEISSLRSSMESLTKTVNNNMQEILRSTVGSERWQDAHEKLDGERWQRLEAMVEAIPVEIVKDLGHLETAVAALSAKVSEHEKMLERIKSVWLTASVIGSLAMAALEFFMHVKGG